MHHQTTLWQRSSPLSYFRSSQYTPSIIAAPIERGHSANKHAWAAKSALNGHLENLYDLHYFRRRTKLETLRNTNKHGRRKPMWKTTWILYKYPHQKWESVVHSHNQRLRRQEDMGAKLNTARRALRFNPSNDGHLMKTSARKLCRK